MKCNECVYREEIEVPDDHAFDTEFRVFFTHTCDYCTHHPAPIEDAYIDCEYRDLEVTAEEIQHVKNLLSFERNNYYVENAITELNKLLER